MGNASTILLAEDNASYVEFAVTALKNHKVAARIDVVCDGYETIEYLNKEGKYAHREGGNPDLILLDIKMPWMDGIGVLGKIKSDARLRTIPVVMLTASCEDRDIAESYNLDVNAYVVKPYIATKLVDIVNRIINQKRKEDDMA